MYRLGFKEKDRAEVKLTTFIGLRRKQVIGVRRKQQNSRNTSTSALLTAAMKLKDACSLEEKL